MTDVVSPLDTGRCRFNCRTAKEMWMLGWIAAANMDMDYDTIDDDGMTALALEEYREYKQEERKRERKAAREQDGRGQGIDQTYDDSRADDIY